MTSNPCAGAIKITLKWRRPMQLFEAKLQLNQSGLIIRHLLTLKSLSETCRNLSTVYRCIDARQTRYEYLLETFRCYTEPLASEAFTCWQAKSIGQKIRPYNQPTGSWLNPHTPQIQCNNIMSIILQSQE